MKSPLITLFICLAFLILCSTPIYADVILDNSSILADSYVYQASPTSNYGNQTFMEVAGMNSPPLRNYRAYIMFNLSSLPANITITGASLGLYDYAHSPSCAPPPNLTCYNTTLNWNETNITWNTQPTASILQDNKTVCNGAGDDQYYYWNVTNAVLSATNIVSFEVRQDKENTSTASVAQFFTKEYTGLSTYKPILIVNYTLNDCTTTCGACGCNDDLTDCKSPGIIGATQALDIDNRTIRCVPDNTCQNDVYFVCPEGTVSQQVTPQVNSTQLVEVLDLSAEQICGGCWYFNLYYLNRWNNVFTNCPELPQCNCNSLLCAKYIYNTTNESYAVNTTITITNYTAGCFNPSTSWTFPVYDANCNQTTIQNLTTQYCPDCVQTVETTCINTSTECYDSNCNPIDLSNCILPSGIEGTGAAGQLAGLVGTLFGIANQSTALAVFSLIISIAIGFVLMWYTKNSEQGGNAFIFGVLAPLIMFSVMGWFPAWILVVMLVAAAFLVAKSLGLGSG